jgi:hypothetical protein
MSVNVTVWWSSVRDGDVEYGYRRGRAVGGAQRQTFGTPMRFRATRGA